MASDKQGLPIQLIDLLSENRRENSWISNLYQSLSKQSNLFKFDHELIAKKIYDLSEAKADYLGYNSGLMLQLSSDEEEMLVKLLHAIQLSIVQRDYFLSQVRTVKLELENAQQQTEQVMESLNKLTETSDQLKKQVEEITDTKSSIYSDMVAVLGVFTAITFALFGGTSLLGSMFKSISNPTPIKLGYSFIVSGVYFLVLYGLIAVLFTGMYRVMKSKEYKFHGGVTTFAIFFGVLMIVVGMIVIGLN